MKALFIEYPKCTTCQKAAKWLSDNKIDFERRNIVIQNPSADELSVWMPKSGLPINRFFNTSGLRYKALGLKDVVKTAPTQELLRILSSEGMLVKRPLLITDKTVLVGFREQEWAEALLK